jgi:flagellar biosynthetic protein FlhB
MLKAVLKIAVMAWVVVGEYQARFDEFTGMIHLTVPAAASRIIAMVFSMAFKAVLALFAIAMADYLYQWWEYERNLRMTKEEVKQEYKREEGDPQIRQRRRQRQREMSAMRMMQALPKADVVITNPTHYAIALMYDESESPAPIVIAKGKDFLAQKIKEKAKELKIEMVENRPVAQALYVSCEVGDSIPQDLFAAVAEILASVYRMRQPNRPSQGA